MFEKEAEEWVKTKGTDAITCLKENIGWDDVCEQAFKDGAEFGYNKAKEELQAQIEKMKCCGNCWLGNCVNTGQKGIACKKWIFRS